MVRVSARTSVIHPRPLVGRVSIGHATTVETPLNRLEENRHDVPSEDYVSTNTSDDTHMVDE